jgi:hypothetical protein
MSHSLRVVGGSFLVWVLFACVGSAAWAEAPLFEIVPQEDDRVPFGRLAVIEGLAHPDGVRLVLRNLSTDNPVQVTLVSDDDELTLQTFTGDWAQALMETETDGGEATLRFRTASSAQFMVKGDDDVRYQLFAWVGPAMKMPPPPIFMTSEEFEDTEGGGLSKIVLLLLVGGGAYLFFKTRSKGASSAVVLLLAVSGGWLAADAGPAAADEKSLEELLKPENIKQTDEWKRTSKAMNKMREELDKLPESGISQIDDTVKSTKLIIAFLEQFGFIDPREAAVQPDYTPEGMPSLPSRCYSEPRGDCAACFAEANANLDKWRGLLEDLWVIYKATELEAGRILELADAAAGLSPLANFAWKVSKSNPNEAHVKSQANFYAKYDENYNELIKRLNDGLIAVGNCEQKFYDDDDWYNRYGLPYYLFMRDRYQRK